MSQPLSLPPGYLFRPARSSDKGEIRRLLSAFRQEVLPPVSRLDWMLRIATIVLLLVAGTYLAIALGMHQLLRLLISPAIVLGLGISVALVLTWNDEWKNFWVIESNDTLIACAKLRCYARYSVLHDLFVLAEWRSQGIGSSLVAKLGEQATRPLYLTCLPTLVSFYMRLGFMPVSTHTLSPLLQYDLGIPGRLNVIPLVLPDRVP